MDSSSRAQYERYVNGLVDCEHRDNHDTMSSDDASRFKINEGICRPTRKYNNADEIHPHQMVTINVSSIKQGDKKLLTSLNKPIAMQMENSDSFHNHSSV